MIGFLLTGLAMVTGYRHWQAQGWATAGIGQTDKPLALVNRDLFGAKNLAWQLARIIKSRDTRPPMTIFTRERAWVLSYPGACGTGGLLALKTLSGVSSQ